MRVAIVVGHRKSSQGAVSKTGITEFEYNSELSKKIKEINKINDIDIIFRDDTKNGLRKLPNKINKVDYDLIVSLHCNALNTKISGHEVLYFKHSKASKRYATEFNNMLDSVVGNNDRGIKPVDTGERGSFILRKTNAPCVLLEPFFIDNPLEMNSISIDKELLAIGIVELLDKLSKEVI